ncbi:MAG: RAMP superfamily CRISPR-associated protein [Candidatus Thorarchaeota archaeon]
MGLNRPRKLTFEILSDTTFGGGTGLLVDTEIAHDELGLPVIPGKTIRGLLRCAWLSMKDVFNELEPAASRVLGESRGLDDGCILAIGDAGVDEQTKTWIQWIVESERLFTSSLILDSITSTYTQTAVDRSTGAPLTASLRMTRTLAHGIALEADLYWLDEPSDDDIRVLALTALATRNVGLARNRGRGHVRVLLDGDLAATRAAAGTDGGENQ